MNYGKSLEEVWQWRESLSKELKDKSPEEQRKYLNNKADSACIKYDIKVRRLPMRQAA